MRPNLYWKYDMSHMSHNFYLSMTPLTDLDDRRTRSFEISLSERNYSKRFWWTAGNAFKARISKFGDSNEKKLESEFSQTLQKVVDGTMELPRDKIESDLQFIRLITFKNNLKPTSIEVIEQLKTANLKSIMVTGDNLETAVSVSQEVGIIDSNHKDGFKNLLRYIWPFFETLQMHILLTFFWSPTSNINLQRRVNTFKRWHQDQNSII